MRIGVDIRCLAQGKNTGVEVYTRRLLCAIFQEDRENEYVLFFNAWKGQGVDLSWVKKYENVSVKKYTIPNKILNFSLWFLQWPRLDRLCGGVDVFFMPNSNFVALSRSCKMYLTVHDLSFVHYKNAFSLKRQLWHFFVNPRSLMKRAHHLFAISHYTKKDICSTYGISSQKITVTPNGLSAVRGIFDRNSVQLIHVKEKYDLPYSFLLYFGTIEPRKNITGLIRAYTMLRKDSLVHDHSLVIAGARGWRAKEIYYEIARSPYKDDIIIIEDIAEEEKEALYTLSAVFIYPSFFEGFGFPPLEAMVSGVRVITAHTTALPETVGKHAVMIDAERIDELVYAIAHTCASSRDLISKERRDYAREFTWKSVANSVMRKIA
jgi:glycosyltransferase involved in cell wall biosynthesis